MDYTFKILKSSEMNEKEISDFVFVQREVFPDADMKLEDFKLKFLDNIYGDSIIVLAYNQDEIAGARAFWRNDIGNRVSYQPSDTAVREKYRRQGLFVKMTVPVLEMLNNNEIVYNFPNNNSYPQYMKLGWKDYKIQYSRIFTPSAYQKEEPDLISQDYFYWWVKPHLTEKYGYTKVFGKYYLVRQLSNNGRFIVFGQLNKECAMELTKKSPKLMIYQSEKCQFYNRGKKISCKIVCRCENQPTYIPSWKTDVY